MKFTMKLIGIIVILAFFIIFGLMYHVYFTDGGSMINSTKQTDTMINIALSNDLVKSYIDNQTYNISKVSTEQRYVLIYIGNTSEGWNKLLVGIDLINNNITYTYLSNQYGSKVNPQSSDPDREAMMINLALSSNTVKSIINNQRYIVKSTDLDQQTVWIGIGEPYYLHQVNVVVDLNYNAIKSVGDMGCIGPPPIIETGTQA